MHDHRRLGRELDLFDTDPLMGAGLPYWLPDGAIVRHELEEYVRKLERAAGYRHVYSPVLGKRELYEISGHWSHYSDDMFPPMKLGAEEVVLRPSLCPHHALIYRSRSHSYRELPLRMAELGAMYRSELSGVLGGLTRVRAIQLNDAHIFCTLDQAVDEAREALALITLAYADLGIRASRHRLSLPGEGGKYVADPALWRRATALLARGPRRLRHRVRVRRGRGRLLRSEDRRPDHRRGRPRGHPLHRPDRLPPARTLRPALHRRRRGKHRPVMVHRSVIGSVERAVAHLVEEHGGAFPPWLAPVQLAVLPVSEAQAGPAHELLRRAQQRGLRAELAAPGDGSLGARVRAARLTPYQAVIGEREAADGLVAVRLRDGRRIGPLAPAELLHHIGARVGRAAPRCGRMRKVTLELP